MADYREESRHVDATLNDLVSRCEAMPAAHIAKALYHKAVSVDWNAVADAVNAARDTKPKVTGDQVKQASQDRPKESETRVTDTVGETAPPQPPSPQSGPQAPAAAPKA